MKAPKILIVDDDRTVCQSLRLLFLTRGFEVQYLINPFNIVEFMEGFSPDLLLLDLNFSIETTGEEGLQILKRVRQHHPDVPVVLLTAWGTLALAVSGMKAGAADFITKPWDNDGVVETVRTHLALRRGQVRANEQKVDTIIGESPAIRDARELILRVASTQAPVLITGPAGSGKELLAETLHDVSSRSEEPFLKADIRSTSGVALERMLLGYKRGAFEEARTDQRGLLARAARGTVFLDEIGHLPASFQGKLLSIVEERTFFPVGSHLSEGTRCGWVSGSCLAPTELREKIREDLYYRLGTVHIHLPPLAERTGDVPLLASHFLAKLNEGEKRRKLDDRALEWLATQEFPGNVRQLKTLIETTWLLSDQYLLSIKELKKNMAVLPVSEHSLPTLEEMEKQMIEQAIALKRGNMSEAARSLGITRSALYRRMAKFGLTNSSDHAN